MSYLSNRLTTCSLNYMRNSRHISSLIMKPSSHHVNSTFAPRHHMKADIPSIRSFKRHFGIIDAVTSFTSSRVEKTKEQQFSKMVDTMVNSSSWTLRQWKTMLEGQLGSWMQYIPGVSSSSEVVQIKKFKSILDALSEKELDDVNAINGTARERVAATSAQPVDDVAKMIFFYKQTLILHTWLRLKKQNNETLPANEYDMVRMQESDIRIQDLVRKISGKTRKTGRGRSLPI